MKYMKTWKYCSIVLAFACKISKTTKHILLDSLDSFIEKCQALYSESSNIGLFFLDICRQNDQANIAWFTPYKYSYIWFFEVQIWSSISKLGPFRSWVLFEVESFEVGSFEVKSFSKLSPFRSWVLFEVESSEVQSFEVGSFEVQLYEVRSFEVQSFEVQSFEAQSVNHTNHPIGHMCMKEVVLSI